MRAASNVLLGVMSLAEREQLHYFTGEVFVRVLFALWA
jgi:hypothetical protein